MATNHEVQSSNLCRESKEKKYFYKITGICYTLGTNRKGTGAMLRLDVRKCQKEQERVCKQRFIFMSLWRKSGKS